MTDKRANNPANVYSTVRSGRSVDYLMTQVLLAMAPGVVLTSFLFGIGVVIQIVIAASVLGAVECLVSYLRGEALTTGLLDRAWLVLAVILGVSVPPYCPWEITVSGALFAAFVGKHLFGGTGQNLFNPAMVGVVFVLVCFPKISGVWPSLVDAPGISWQTGVAMIFTPKSQMLDAVSGATLLEFERTQIALAAMRSEFEAAPIYGVFAERGWEWVNLAYLIGGIYLCLRRVIRITIPVCFLGSLFVLASIAHGVDSERFAGPFVHWFAGASMLCAFFIATDPVTSPTGRKAAAIYGVLLAVLLFLFRVYGAYPDGVAFAVVLLNVFVPMLDRLFSPQIYGHKS